jgi:thioredoxin 1
MVAPTVDKLAQEYAGRAVIGKVNVDEQTELAEKFRVMSIPTLYILKNGQVVERLIGARPTPSSQQPSKSTSEDLRFQLPLTG